MILVLEASMPISESAFPVWICKMLCLPVIWAAKI